MRRVLVIGIGAGDPEHVTVQAINALNQADVFFVIEKGHETEELVALRREICERFIKERRYRFVDMETPKRSQEFSDYRSNVEEWHASIEKNYKRLLKEELADGQFADRNDQPRFQDRQLGQKPFSAPRDLLSRGDAIAAL